jgi:hypothetical protein
VFCLPAASKPRTDRPAALKGRTTMTANRHHFCATCLVLTLVLGASLLAQEKPKSMPGGEANGSTYCCQAAAGDAGGQKEAGKKDKTELDLGLLDLDKVPPAKLVAPKTGEGISLVSLREVFSGKTRIKEKLHVYVLVMPLSNPQAKRWWVQQEVDRAGDQFKCLCQFGEADVGLNEFFAVVGLATDQQYAVGEQLETLPKNAAFSKLLIVKRTN